MENEEPVVFVTAPLHQVEFLSLEDDDVGILSETDRRLLLSVARNEECNDRPCERGGVWTTPLPPASLEIEFGCASEVFNSITSGKFYPRSLEASLPLDLSSQYEGEGSGGRYAAAEAGLPVALQHEANRGPQVVLSPPPPLAPQLVPLGPQTGVSELGSIDPQSRSSVVPQLIPIVPRIGTPQHVPLVPQLRPLQHISVIPQSGTPQHVPVVQQTGNQHHVPVIPQTVTPQHVPVVQQIGTQQHVPVISQSGMQRHVPVAPQHAPVASQTGTPQHVPAVPKTGTPQQVSVVPQPGTPQHIHINNFTANLTYHATGPSSLNSVPTSNSGAPPSTISNPASAPGSMGSTTIPRQPVPFANYSYNYVAPFPQTSSPPPPVFAQAPYPAMMIYPPGHGLHFTMFPPTGRGPPAAYSANLVLARENKPKAGSLKFGSIPVVSVKHSSSEDESEETKQSILPEQSEESYLPQQPADRTSYLPQQPADRTSYLPQQSADRTSYQPQQPEDRTSYPPQQAADQTSYQPQQPADRTSYPPQQAADRISYPPQQSADRNIYPPQKSADRNCFPPQQASDRTSYHSPQLRADRTSESPTAVQDQGINLSNKVYDEQTSAVTYETDTEVEHLLKGNDSSIAKETDKQNKTTAPEPTVLRQRGDENVDGRKHYPTPPPFPLGEADTEPLESKTEQKSWASLFTGSAPSTERIPVEKPMARIPPFSSKEAPTASVPPPGTTHETIKLGLHLKQYCLNHVAPSFLPRGLTNRSNWCFVNAILQALLACPPFYNLLKDLPPTSRSAAKSSTPMMDSLAGFVNEFVPLETMNKNQKKDKTRKREDVTVGNTFEPSSVYKVLLDSDTFKVVEGRQEDAEEFLTCLLNMLDDEMRGLIKLTLPAHEREDPAQNGVSAEEEWQEMNVKGRSTVTRRAGDTSTTTTPIQRMASGQVRSSVRVLNSEASSTLQPFYALQLDIQAEAVLTVEDALRQNFSTERIHGYICPKTRQVAEASRTGSLEILPPILVLHLKRMVYDGQTGRCQKVMKEVAFPVDLEISRDILSVNSKTRYSLKQRQYKLFAVVYHNGMEATKGHYVTDVYHTGYVSWLRCDDSTVRASTEQSVVRAAPGSAPYILFYRRCDTMVGVDKSSK